LKVVDDEVIFAKRWARFPEVEKPAPVTHGKDGKDLVRNGLLRWELGDCFASLDVEFRA